MYELASKEIVDLFLGDKRVNSESDDKFESNGYTMPYMTHSDINALAPIFGITNIENVSDYNRLNKMAWLIEQCYKLNKENKLLKYFLDVTRYIPNKREETSIYTNEELKKETLKEVEAYFNHINNILNFSDKKLIYLNEKYKIIDLIEDSQVTHDIDKHINFDYVRNFLFRLKDNLEDENYDTVITQSRTSLEEVYIHILEYSNKDYSSAKGNLQKLNSMVKTELKMKNNRDYDKRINELLSGLNKINDAIGKMRNENSDSHGVGSKRININRREAKLVMNSAIIICDYILEIFEDNKNNNKI
ncbi:abortive infection family protein [Mammaliicoccus sciuri]|uniref:abortive infection family protein n=1 Tax=Mammaliicoccus sciuri TaxID=1296 RepID=UPI0021CDFD75|nr:abortive infection family protein [Mammaliicoccus sciuri]UXV29464.1 abortive infection family protein [Mammaliicoccus sciuri]